MKYRSPECTAIDPGQDAALAVAPKTGRSEGILRFLLPSIGEVLFLCVFLPLALSRGTELLYDADTGYHIRAGQYMLRTLSVPTHDIFSYLSPPLPWTAHEWLSEVIMALLHSFQGLTTVVLFFSFLIGVEFIVLFKMVRSNGGDIFTDLLIVLPVILASQIHWLARPHIFSLLLMTLWYYALDQYQYRDRNHLVFLPCVMLLWVNLHGGFILGLLLVCVYLAGNARPAFSADAAARTAARRKVRHYGLLLAFCLLASLCNPQGFHILAFPFRVTANSYLMDNVNEFLSPNFHKTTVFRYLLLLTVAILAASRKRLGDIEILLLLLFLNMSLFSARYIPLFGVIAAPVLSRQAGEIVRRGRGKVLDFFRSRSRRIAAVDSSARGHLWPLAAVLAAAVLTSAGTVSFAFDKNREPVAATDFLKREQISGNMFNNDEFGDYIIYAAWPQYHVFFDGRSDMYGAARMKDYFTVSGVKRDWESVLKKYGINWIVFDSDSALATFLEGRKGWRLVYADAVAEIFVRDTPEYATLIAKYPDVKPVRHRASKGKQAGDG